MNHKKAIQHFSKVDPAIHQFLIQVSLEKWFDELDQKNHFQSLTSTIIGQQLSLKAARTIRGRVVDLMPGKTLTPENILAVSQDDLRSAGMSWAKIRSIRDLSERVLDGKLDLTALDSMDDEKVTDSLVTVKGIGVWTAEMFLIFNLGRQDIYSFGDGGLRQAIVKLYHLKEYTPKSIEKIIAPWSPFKSYACIALWHSLDNA